MKILGGGFIRKIGTNFCLILIILACGLSNFAQAEAAEYSDGQAISKATVYFAKDYIIQEETTPTEQATSVIESNKQGKLPQTSEKKSYLSWVGFLILIMLILIKKQNERRKI